MPDSNLTYSMIQDAAATIAPYLLPTQLICDHTLSTSYNCQVYYKPEMLQTTGSFKIRGAMNKILSLTDEEREKGILCSSSGNHGKACAYACKLLGGLPLTVVLPDDTPHAKADGITALGGQVLYGPRLYSERWKLVNEVQKEKGYTIVHGYEDYSVMAGQGTIAIEILFEEPDLDTIVVPVGGGGLIAGIAVAAKAIKPDIKIIGVQAKASDAYVESFRIGKPVEVPCFESIADGIGCRRPGKHPYPIIMEYVNDFVAVEEEDIVRATKLVAEHAKVIAEPTSCVGVAALLSGQIVPSRNEKIGFILTSGNWDIDKLGKIYTEA